MQKKISPFFQAKLAENSVANVQLRKQKCVIQSDLAEVVVAAGRAAVPKMQNAEQLLDWLSSEANDLEARAIALAPAIAEALASLRAAAGCRLARMSGSGATCFALFSSDVESAAAGKKLRTQFPDWWISATVLG